MRITGGQLRGRVIAAPVGLAVRPTASKIRQAFFNILRDKVPDGAFVDVCAGSGLMGLEALSRGAASLIAIEENRAMVQAIQASIKSFGVGDRAEVIAANARRALPLLRPREADIIFADPPYRTVIAESILALVGEHDLLTETGVLALEHEQDRPLAEASEHLCLYDRRKYGQTAVSFYRRKSK